jgi:hypothetical protein
MSNTNTGGPAFAVAELANVKWEGMTLRDYFAAKAMQAILSEDPEYHQKYQFIDLAHFSYKCADAMLKEREE